MTALFTSDNLIALLTLTALEIVLGIDNVVFIAILAGKLPEARRAAARQVGLILALGTRLALVAAITWIMRLTEPLFSILSEPISGRDLILLVGGLFLIGKATYEIHHKVEGAGEQGGATPKVASFAAVVTQIAIVDIVFSLDSVITAVGMVPHIEIMVAAIVVSVGVMLIFAGPISNFIDKHPTFKILALSFLLLIGVMLVIEGSGGHVDKGYIYFAMGFSLLVEVINMRIRKTEVKTA